MNPSVLEANPNIVTHTATTLLHMLPLGAIATGAEYLGAITGAAALATAAIAIHRLRKPPRA